jgi:hypothetical protein
MSAWMVLTLFIPFINIIMAIICGCVSGTEGSNKYGHDPRSEAPQIENNSLPGSHAPPSKTTCDQCGGSFPSSLYLERSSQDGRYLCEGCRGEVISSAVGASSAS